MGWGMDRKASQSPYKHLHNTLQNSIIWGSNRGTAKVYIPNFLGKCTSTSTGYITDSESGPEVQRNRIHFLLTLTSLLKQQCS